MNVLDKTVASFLCRFLKGSIFLQEKIRLRKRSQQIGKFRSVEAVGQKNYSRTRNSLISAGKVGIGLPKIHPRLNGNIVHLASGTLLTA